MFIRIEPTSGVPITRQIADQVHTLCATGALKPGDQLPSVRALARRLAVNQNTILRVYERLTAEGLLERRHGSGTYVAERMPSGQMREQRDILRQEAARLAARAAAMGLDRSDLVALLDQALKSAERRSPEGRPSRKEGQDE